MFCSRFGALARSVTLAAVAAFGLLFTTSTARSEDGEGLELAPNHTDVVAVIEVAKILESSAFKQLAGEFPDFAANLDKPLGKQTKLTPRDIESVFVAVNSTKQEFVVVLNLKEEFEIDDVLAKSKQGGATEIGDFTLYAIEDGQALCLVDESTIAIGPVKTLTAVLNREDAPKISAELTAAWDNIDDSEQITVIATLDKLVKQGADAIPPGLPVSPETLAKLKTATLTATTQKKLLRLTTALDCTNNATANQLKGVVDLLLQTAQQDANTPEEFKALLKGVKSSTEEEILTIGFQVEIDSLLKQFKAQILDAVSTAATP